MNKCVRHILAAFSLILVTSANADLHIDFSESGANVIMTISGSWDVWVSGIDSPGQNSTSFESTANRDQAFTSGDDGYSLLNTFSITGTPDGLWTGGPVSLSGTNVSGAAGVIVNTGTSLIQRRAPIGYTAGDAINASATFTSTSLTAMGLPSSGAFEVDLISVGGPENFTWGVNGAVIPEASTVMMFVAGAVGLSVYARRRKMQK